MRRTCEAVRGRSPRVWPAVVTRAAACAALLLSTLAAPAVAQTTAPDQRGITLSTGAQQPAPAQTTQAGKAARPELVLQTGYSNFFGAGRLVFSPDARLLATTTLGGGTVKLWETATGRELRNLSTGAGAAYSLPPPVAFSRDSRMVASAGGDGSVKIWDVLTGRELQTLAGQAGGLGSILGVSRVAFGPDGRTLSTVGDAVRVWDVATGQTLRTLEVGLSSATGYTGGGVVFSPDGGQLAAIVSDSGKPQVKVWDLAPGREARSVSLPDKGVQQGELVFTIDGRVLAAYVSGGKLKVFDATAKKERALGPAAQQYPQMKFSDDGSLVALSEGYTVKIFELATGRELPALKIPNNGLYPDQNFSLVGVGFSPDGRMVATGGFDAPTLLWEAQTGKQLRGMAGRSNTAYEVAFSADGTRLFSGGRTQWDLATGRGLRITAGASDKLRGLPSRDGRLLAAIGPRSATVRVLEAATGRVLHSLTPAGGGEITHAAFSPDGRLLVTTYIESEEQRNKSQAASKAQVEDLQKASKEALKAAQKDPNAFLRVYQQSLARERSDSIENQVKIWDVATGRELRTLSVAEPSPEVRFSGDGRVLATVGTQGGVTLWDVTTGQPLSTLSDAPAPQPGALGIPQNPADLNAMMSNMLGAMAAGTSGRKVTSVAFSPDGKMVATGGVETKTDFDASALMGGMMSGKGAKNRPNPQDFLKNLKVETTGQIALWDAATGRQTGTLRGHGKSVLQVAFSRDGRLLASSAADGSIKIWDVASGQSLRTLLGHTASVNSMDFGADGRLLASASDDGSTFLWDVRTGEHLVTLVSLFDGGDWLVVSPDGLFDGSPAGWNQVLWRYDRDTFNVAPIEWFFNEFYYPGLLSDVFAGKRPRATEDISEKIRNQPAVKISLAEAAQAAPGAKVTTRDVRVRIEVTEAPADGANPQSSGARDLRLFRNGSLIKVWRGDVLAGKPAGTFEATIPVVAGENRLLAYAFNRDNVKSRDAFLEVTGDDSLRREGKAYVLAVGVNSYANPQYNLKYAVADARDFAAELVRQQAKLGLFLEVEIIPLNDKEATKANIMRALSDLAAKVQPEDGVVVYFAGHGTAQANQFYLIPHDLGYKGDRTRLDAAGLKSIIEHSISDRELEQAFERIDAGRLLLVIDACNSGQALEAEEKRRGPMNSKGLAQLAYEKGMYVLTAAQSFQAALEATQLGHGLLTYALVEEGLKTPAADSEPKDGEVRVREWLDYATERVPQMQEEKMREARGRGVSISFVEGGESGAGGAVKTIDAAAGGVQRPRAFYRRELEARPLVVAKPAAQ